MYALVWRHQLLSRLHPSQPRGEDRTHPLSREDWPEQLRQARREKDFARLLNLRQEPPAMLPIYLPFESGQVRKLYFRRRYAQQEVAFLKFHRLVREMQDAFARPH